jgi:hypothetical protein
MMKLAEPLDLFLARAGKDDRLLPTHMSLFMAILYHSDGGFSSRPFRITRRKLMLYSRIKSKATYHRCLSELVAYGYITYQPSFDPIRASTMTIILHEM